MALPAWLSFLTPKTIETAAKAGKNITDGIVNGIDAIWLTEEEKIQYKQKGTETILKFWELTAKENTEQSKARRELAKMTFLVFFLFLISSAVVWKFDPEYSEILLRYADMLTFIVSSIAVIYFGPHQISKIWKKNGDK